MAMHDIGGAMDRRRFLSLSAAVGGTLVGGWALGRNAASAATGTRSVLSPRLALPPRKELKLAATDGWIYLPGHAGGFHPDPWADPPFTNWGFGFRDVTGLSEAQVLAQRNHFQNPAPTLYADEGGEMLISLRNLGLLVRPDLTDSHSIHWHGFRDAIPLFDGVPELSIAVPVGREFTYYYRPTDPGTYMYHCHFEDVEHVSMGMSGVVFVRPAQNAGIGTDIPAGKYAYNDGVPPADPRSTAYDREWSMFLTEAWTQSRYNGAHIQEHDWSEWSSDAWMLNGRCYPDTLAPNGSQGAAGNLIAPPGRPELERQPISSLVRANSGDRVLLRIVNLGFGQQSMTLNGLTMRVVGKDAVPMVGRDGTDTSYLTDTIQIGPGESVDVIVVCPVVSSETTFLFANRNYRALHNPGMSGLGGQLTEFRVLPGTTLPPQDEPNH